MMLLRRMHATALDQVASAARRGLARLSAMQTADGSFPLARHDGKGPPRQCHGLFSTLAVLLAVGDQLHQDNRDAALEFVVDQRRADGMWEFDPALRIPFDSDVVSCALAALARYAHPIACPASADLLRSFWRGDGGPFMTWGDAPQQWRQRDRDDAVVNCNILLALNALGVPPTAVERRAVIDLVNRSTKGTRYYCSATNIAYAARRAGLPAEVIDPRMFARPRRSAGALASAQWLSAVVQWDSKAVARVLAAQTAAGEWPAEDWCQGAGSDRWASAAVTTALCIEGLQTSAAVRTGARRQAYWFSRFLSWSSPRRLAD